MKWPLKWRESREADKIIERLPVSFFVAGEPASRQALVILRLRRPDAAAADDDDGDDDDDDDEKPVSFRVQLSGSN